jgi:hypothetical protein
MEKGAISSVLLTKGEAPSEPKIYLNAWCELAKSLQRKGGFPDTQTESHLVQRITPLFSTTAFQ